MENEFSLKLPSAKSECALGAEFILVFKRQIAGAQLSAAFSVGFPSLIANTVNLSEAAMQRSLTLHVQFTNSLQHIPMA